MKRQYADEDFQLQKDYKTANLYTQKPYLNKKKLLDTKLDFEIKYALFSGLSQKKIDLYAIDKEFLSKLCEKAKNPTEAAILEKTLKDIAMKNRHLSFE
mmetsp:Transcript_12397/g.10676  ORF Transcript_12397/g.10676 Transcript_12397/m.10676 type:complete len:99 (+) Transcript_12397:126-422(+)